MECANKPGCRCDGCKSFNNMLAGTLRKSMQQMGLSVQKRAKRTKREIFQGLAPQVTVPKQPKSLPGQMSLLDLINE